MRTFKASLQPAHRPLHYPVCLVSQQVTPSCCISNGASKITNVENTWRPRHLVLLYRHLSVMCNCKASNLTTPSAPAAGACLKSPGLPLYYIGYSKFHISSSDTENQLYFQKHQELKELHYLRRRLAEISYTDSTLCRIGVCEHPRYMITAIFLTGKQINWLCQVCGLVVGRPGSRNSAIHAHLYWGPAIPCFGPGEPT